MDTSETDISTYVAGLKTEKNVSETDIGFFVFDRFYIAAKKRGIVWTLCDLAVRDKLFDGDDVDFSEDDIPDFKNHGQAIEHVLQMEVSIFVFRHLNGPWGEVIDGMRMNRNVFTNTYRERTGYQIDTGQDHLLW